MISGLQKMTLLDFPGKVACTVFLQGCNFRCPFCHNSGLLGTDAPEEIGLDQLLTFLKKRQGLLDGVCITGGEPTLQPGLADLLRSIKELGYAVKLDTNGSRPDVLTEVVQNGLVDYVAMDIKSSPARYGEAAGMPRMGLEKVEKSIKFLLEDTVDYEFRTTVAAELHDEQTMEDIGKWLSSLSPKKKAPRFFIQAYMDRDSVLMPGLHAPEKELLEAFVRRIAPYVHTAQLRGTD